MRYFSLPAGILSLLLLGGCTPDVPTAPEPTLSELAPHFSHHTDKSEKVACIKTDEDVKGPLIVYADADGSDSGSDDDDVCPNGYDPYAS